MPLLSISASDIDTAGVSIDAELPLLWLDQELSDAEVRGQVPGRVQARLSRSGTDIVVRGKINAKVSTPCARCLDPAPVDVAADLSLLLKPAPAEAAARGKAKPSTKERAAKAVAPAARRGKDSEHEFAAGEADLDTYDGETVVLDAFVREAILLELPNFPLCSEACPGIPPSTGGRAAHAGLDGRGGKPIDPRLAPLKAIQAKLSQVEPARPKSQASRRSEAKSEAPRLKTNVVAKKKKKKK